MKELAVEALWMLLAIYCGRWIERWGGRLS